MRPPYRRSLFRLLYPNGPERMPPPDSCQDKVEEPPAAPGEQPLLLKDQPPATVPPPLERVPAVTVTPIFGQMASPAVARPVRANHRRLSARRKSMMRTLVIFFWLIAFLLLIVFGLLHMPSAH